MNLLLWHYWHPKNMYLYYKPPITFGYLASFRLVIWQNFDATVGRLLMRQLADERTSLFPFCQRKSRLSLCLTLPLADSPHRGWMPDTWIWSYTSELRVPCSDTHTSDKYLPLLLRPYPALGIRYVGPLPDIPKRSAGQGLSSLTMNRSTIRPLHSFP